VYVLDTISINALTYYLLSSIFHEVLTKLSGLKTEPASFVGMMMMTTTMMMMLVRWNHVAG